MATIQDSLADPAVLEEGTGITIAQAAPGDPVVITSSGGYTDEQARDAIAAALVAGANVTITPNDGADTITIAATDTNTTDAEVVRDTMATALVAGANVTITPNDGADTITIAAATDAEVVRDTIGAALVAGTNVTITPNDGADTITIAAAGGSGIAATLIDAKGDLLVGTANDTADRLAAGTDGYALVADSAQTKGLKWIGNRFAKIVIAGASDLSLNATAITALAAASPLSTAAALDITLAAAVGDEIECGLNAYYSATAQLVTMDVYTMVAGSRVNPFGAGLVASAGTLLGISGWLGSGASVSAVPIGAPVFKTIVSGDLSSGTVTLRPHYAKATTTARNMSATANASLVFWARNLGPA